MFSQSDTCVPPQQDVPEKVPSYTSATFSVFSLRLEISYSITTMTTQKLQNQVLKSEIPMVVLTTILSI